MQQLGSRRPGVSVDSGFPDIRGLSEKEAAARHNCHLRSKSDSLRDRRVLAIVDPACHHGAEAAMAPASWKGFLRFSLASCRRDGSVNSG